MKKGSSKFTAEEWNSFSTATKEEWLMKRRLIYSAYGDVNWCEALGTVLANDEVVNGVSERGGHPVEKRKMRQWYLRITAYADRLLQGLEKVDFSDSMKEMQTNWIGKSSGAEVDFEIKGQAQKLRVYTTRPDTIFGVDFMVVAPEMDLIHQIKSKEQEEAVAEYLDYVKSRSDRERMSEKKLPAFLQVLMQSIHLMEEKFPFGYRSMCWQDMAPALLWLCLVAMKEILGLQNILIFPLPILSGIILMAKKPMQQKKRFWKTRFPQRYGDERCIGNCHSKD
jgi:hypothetical protein